MRENSKADNAADTETEKRNSREDGDRRGVKFSQRLVMTVAIALCTGLLLYAGLWTLAKVSQVRSRTDFENRIDDCVEYITYAVNSDKASGLELGDAYDEVRAAAYALPGRVLIVNTAYMISVDTYNMDTGSYLVDEDVYRVMNGIDKSVVRSDGNLYMRIFPIINSEGYTDAVAVIAVDADTLNESSDYVSRSFTYLFVILFLPGIAAAFAIARLSVRDVLTVGARIEGMKGGNLEQLPQIGMFNETRELTAGINDIFANAQMLEESRQEFVSNVSHELKTPITSMKVLSESLLTQTDVPADKYREFMEDIVQEIDREAEIISDLLTLVKTDKGPESLNREMVDMNEFMELILKRLRPLAEKRSIDLTYESYRDVSAEVDKVKFTLAISNLIENGIKYNIDGGWIKVSLNTDNRNFYIKIADSGVGIPEDCIGHIFERFYRVDKARSRDTGGTGLGLAITKNIILLHGGTINVYSEPGKGTTFTVRVPLGI